MLDHGSARRLARRADEELRTVGRWRAVWRAIAPNPETTVVGLLCVGAFVTKRQSRRQIGTRAASKETALRRHNRIPFGPPIKQEDPLDLSILLSGGKETNQDSLSNGE